MSWICLMCDEICYDEVWPWGDATLCNECYQELTDVRIDLDEMLAIERWMDLKSEELGYLEEEE